MLLKNNLVAFLSFTEIHNSSQRNCSCTGRQSHCISSTDIYKQLKKFHQHETLLTFNKLMKIQSTRNRKYLCDFDDKKISCLCDEDLETRKREGFDDDDTLQADNLQRKDNQKYSTALERDTIFLSPPVICIITPGFCLSNCD